MRACRPSSFGQLIGIPHQVASPDVGPLRRFQLILQILSKHGRRLQTPPPQCPHHDPRPTRLRDTLRLPLVCLWGWVPRQTTAQKTTKPHTGTGTAHTQANNLEAFCYLHNYNNAFPASPCPCPCPSSTSSRSPSLDIKLRRKFCGGNFYENRIRGEEPRTTLHRNPLLYSGDSRSKLRAGHKNKSA